MADPSPLIVLVSVLGLVGQGQESVATMLEIQRRVAPCAITDLAAPLPESLVGSRNGWGVVAGVVGALHTSASSASTSPASAGTTRRTTRSVG